MYKIIRYFLVLISTSTLLLSYGQAVNSSPYSLSGFGDLKFNGFVSQQNMGGVSRALRSEFNYSPINPASYTALRNTVYNAGAYMRYGRMMSDTIEGNVSNSNIGYFSLAFASPYEQKKQWAVSMGFYQLTDVGYDLRNNNADSFNSYNLFKGTGGISTAYIGGAISPAKGLSLGLNMNFNFGSIRTIQAQIYPDDDTHFSYSDEKSIYHKGINFDFGVQYTVQNKEVEHTIGATIHSKTNLNGSGYRYAETFFGRLFDERSIVETIDTILYTDTLRTTSSMPLRFGIGYAVGVAGHWSLSAEYESGLWSSITSNINGKPYFDNQRFALGFAIIPKPDYKTTGKYFSKVNYSAGFRYEKLYYNFFGEQIDEIGIGFGLGLPVIKTFNSRTGKIPIISRVNLGLEYSKRGTTENGLIAEEYLTIRLGLNFNDKWFIKRKYQ